MDEREKNLPKWAQDLIKSLRDRIQYGNEPLIKEVASLRPLCELLKRKNAGLMGLLECAAKGNHLNAQEIINVLEGHSLILAKDD